MPGFECVSLETPELRVQATFTDPRNSGDIEKLIMENDNHEQGNFPQSFSSK
jgi:hypothetical protein